MVDDIYSEIIGYGIRALIFNAFFKFWPELFDLKVVHILNTPIVKVTYRKKVISFYNQEDFENWKESHQDEKYESKYFKGLGTSNGKEWKEYFENLDENLDVVVPKESDKDLFYLHFSKEKGVSDLRKDWLEIEEK